MKKLILLISITTYILLGNFCYANKIVKVGKKVPDWLLEGEDKHYRMTSWPNKLSSLITLIQDAKSRMSGL